MAESDEKIERRVLRHLFLLSRRGALFNIFSAIFVWLYFQISTTHFDFIFTWLITVILIAAIRLILATKVTYTEQLLTLRRYHYYMVWISLANGLVWGALYWVYYYDMNTFQRLFIALILTGGITTAIISLSASVACYYAFVIPVALPIIILNSFSGDLEYFLFGFSIAVYIIFVIFMFYTNHKTLLENSRLFIQQDELIYTLNQLNEQLRVASITDSLTGLANRRHFSEQLADDWRRCKRAKLPLSLILVDVDYFKEYNDYYGHIEGDACLQAIAAILKRLVRRETDLAARFGGDELAVILYNTGIEGTKRLANDFFIEVKELGLEHIRSPYGVVTVSIGVVSSTPEPQESYEKLLIRADQALYRVKHEGRNGISN